MLGTATADVSVWLLLEHRETWGTEIDDCDLPDPVGLHLDELEARHSKLRPLLIRRDDPRGPLNLYVVTTGPGGAVHHFELGHQNELCDIDVDEIVAGRATPPRSAHPLYLVCTHGQRDSCCAQYGEAFYQALTALEIDATIWQSSHHGGHRFAPSVLYLPSGIHYGRLEPTEAAGVVEAHRHEEIFALRRYRGQTSFPQPAQAAEAWLREQHGELAIHGLELLEQSSIAGGRYAIRFRARHQLLHRLVLESRLDHMARPLSCNAKIPELPTRYDVIRHETQMAGSER